MSSGGIIEDGHTTVSVAPKMAKNIQGSIQSSYVHNCSQGDAMNVFTHMPSNKRYLVRKHDTSGSISMYKVAVRNTKHDEVYGEHMLFDTLQHRRDQFITKSDTVQLFHEIRVPPPLLRGGGSVSLFIHPSDTKDAYIKTALNNHYKHNQHNPQLKSMTHVLFRYSDSDDTDQQVDTFYINRSSIYSKTMPLCKAAARFMSGVVIPADQPLLAGGGGARDEDDDDQVDVDDVADAGDGDDGDDDDAGASTKGSASGGSKIMRDLGKMSGDQAFALGSELLQKERHKMVGAQGAIDRTEQGIIDIRNQRIISDGTNAELVSELKADQVRLKVQHESMQEELKNLEHNYKIQKNNLESSIKLNEKEQQSVKDASKSNAKRYKDHQEFLNRREKQLLHENKDAVQRKMQALAGVTAAQGAAEHALGKEAASEQAKARYFQQEFDTRAAEAELTSPPTGYASSPANTEAIYSPAGEYYLSNTPAPVPGTPEGGLAYVDSASPGGVSKDYDTMGAYGQNYHDARAKQLRDINEGTAVSAVAQDEEKQVRKKNKKAAGEPDIEAQEEQADADDASSESSLSSSSLHETHLDETHHPALLG